MIGLYWAPILFNKSCIKYLIHTTNFCNSLSAVQSSLSWLPIRMTTKLSSACSSCWTVTSLIRRLHLNSAMSFCHNWPPTSWASSAIDDRRLGLISYAWQATGVRHQEIKTQTVRRAHWEVGGGCGISAIQIFAG